MSSCRPWGTVAIGIVLILSFFLMSDSNAQEGGQARLQIRMALVLEDMTLRPVPRRPLDIHSDSDGAVTVHLMTNLDGRVETMLAPGAYRIIVSDPVLFDGKKFVWNVPFLIRPEQPETVVELTNDNASPDRSSEQPAAPLTLEGQIFSASRNGVLTVESETGHGSGFVVDPMGLVLTNAHVVEGSREITVAFDGAHRFAAEALVVDSENDIAVLRFNNSAYSEATSLKLVQPGSSQPVRIGDPVMAIGSPLNQEKIITKGIVSKIGEGVILSDVNINHGNSGGPLLNSSGTVVGITTFKDLDPTGGGVSGIIRIEKSDPLLKKAREMAERKTPPSAEPLPSIPEGEFPVSDLKKQLMEGPLDPGDYGARRSTFDVQVMTPALKYFLETKDAADRAESRARKQKRVDQPSKDPDADPYTNLRVWRASLGDFRPVVEIYMLPRLKLSGGSFFGAALVGDSSLLHYRYKSDFDRAELTVDGKTVIPIRRSRFTRTARFASMSGFANDEAFAGVYTFGIEFLKEIHENSHMSITIHDGLKPDKPIQIELDPRTIWKIRNDFSPLLGAPEYPEPELTSVTGGSTG